MTSKRVVTILAAAGLVVATLAWARARSGRDTVQPAAAKACCAGHEAAKAAPAEAAHAPAEDPHGAPALEPAAMSGALECPYLSKKHGAAARPPSALEAYVSQTSKNGGVR